MPCTTLNKGRGMPHTTLKHVQRTPRTAFMQDQGAAPRSLHAGAGGRPALPSCWCRGMPRTALKPGQGDAPHNM